MRATHLATLGLLALVPSAAPDAAGFGGVTGKVIVMDGKRELDPAKLVDGGDVYVYLKPVKRRMKVHAVTGKAINHRKRQFEPRVQVLPAGTQVLFPNRDDESHNAFSPTTGNNFDLGVYGPGSGPKEGHTFLVPGEINIFCDLHKEMWSVVKVVDSDWIAKVDTTGTFRLTDVPAGTYVLVAWTPGSEEVHSEAFTVADGEVVSLDSVPHVEKSHGMPNHQRKDGSVYLPY